MTSPHASAEQDPGAPVRLWLGTYPADGPGGASWTGEGIWALALDPLTGALTGSLAAEAPAPSFLALHPGGGWLYAVGEEDEGSLSAFAIGTDGTLEQRARLSSDGGWPCHLLVHPQGHTLYATNYETGSVVVVPLTPDGAVAPDTVASGRPAATFGHVGSGPRTDRQEGPHAHSSLLLPDGERADAVLVVADLGTDELRRYRVDASGALTEDGVAHRFPAGTGPRHLAVGPGGHLYVVGELTATLHVLRWDAATATAQPVEVHPVCASPVISGEHLYPAHPVVAGDRVVVSVRGADVLAQFAVHDGGARLEHRGDVLVGGSWPRHVAVVEGADGGPGWAVAAVQESGVVTTLPWDGATAKDVVGRFEVPYPTCVLPA